MGLLRFLLATAVVIGHTDRFLYGYEMISGPWAVECFYIISGFYMSLVLTEKYESTCAGIKGFYLSRFFRLMPTYWLLLLVMIAVAALNGETYYLPNTQSLGWLEGAPVLSKLWIVFANIFVVGQDIVQWQTVGSNGGLQWTMNLQPEPTAARQLMILTPAWSLSMEIYFYLLAPWLARSATWFIILLAGSAFAASNYLAGQGFTTQEWQFRIFPIELIFFLAGMLGHRAYSRFKNQLSPNFGWPALVAMAVLILFDDFMPFFPEDRLRFLLIVTALSIPIIFNLTKNIKMDRQLGELSYALYLVHWIVIIGLRPYYEILGAHRELVILLFSVGASLAIYWLVERPIDHFRQSFAAKA